MLSNNPSISLFDSQSVIDALPVGLIWLDQKGKIVLVNKKLAEDVNWNIHDLKDQTIQDICPYLMKENWDTEWQSFKDLKVSVKKTEMMTELGFFFPVQIIFSLIKRNGKDMLFGIVQNLLDICLLYTSDAADE